MRMEMQERVDNLALGTINAGLRSPVSAEELVCWLGALDAAQDARATLALTAFFVETPLETQVEFLRVHGIDESLALAIARRLAVPSEFPLAARANW
jgi:hypothetical protein